MEVRENRPLWNNPYCAYVANVVREYFENNIVIDPFTGKRLEYSNAKKMMNL